MYLQNKIIQSKRIVCFGITKRLSMLFLSLLMIPLGLLSQIYEPEGLNLPGTWNGWQNPPLNNLALASSTQVQGGRVIKINQGVVRWQTGFSVAASGGDVVGGTHAWLFTSGPASNPWMNKWAGVNVQMNTLQNYTYNSGADNSVTLTNGKWYTVNWRDNGYAGTQAIFMETSTQPANLLTLPTPSGVLAGQPVTITLTLDAVPSPEEIFYLRYTTNAWNSSTAITFNMTGTTGTAIIPGQNAGTVVQYYAFSSTVSNITGNFDMLTLKFNNNNGNNYAYTVEGLSTQAEILSFSLPEQTAPATINSAAATVTIEVAHGTDVSNLIPTITISNGATISPASGVAQNFTNPVVYTVTAQDGTTTKQWTVTVTVAPPVPIGWANLQWPPSGNIQPGQEFIVYAQVWADGITNQPGQALGMQAWIGYNSSNTDPSGWTNWFPASYLGDVGNNDEYSLNLGSLINIEGIYYYASRFSLDGQPFVYGGYNSNGGGFWDGTNNVSGQLSVFSSTTLFPVTFKIIDGTQSYTDIRFKGQMTNWNTVPMVQGPPHTWTLTLDLHPGTYEWGAIQHDGTPDGVWLIQGPNLVVSVAADGSISGTTTYNIPALPPASIEWANLQWPPNATIEPAQTFFVYGKVYIPGVTGLPVAPAGLQAWVGYSTSDTNPSTWANWIPASFNGPAGNDSEYKADLGSQLNNNGTYYYAMRYQYQDQTFVYGGYSNNGGGFWNGTTNKSGVLTVGVNIDCNQFRGVVYSIPSFPSQNETVTIYFDATKGNQALLNYTGDVYAHTGVITNLSNNDADWRYIKTNWGQNTPSTLLERISPNLYSLTIPNPRFYYGVPNDETILKLAFVFRASAADSLGNWRVHKNANGSDIYLKLYQSGLNVKFNNPNTRQNLLTGSSTLPVCIEATGHTLLSFYINNNLIRQTENVTLTYQLSYQQMPAGTNWIKAVATHGNLMVRDSIEVYVRGSVPISHLPAGVKKGINYLNDSTVTLVLHDPAAQKQFCYAIGDFNNWTVSDEGYMKRTPDGTHYWITISGLTPGEEYGFQYYLDGALKLADPYSELILDPWNDPWIQASKYPNLKPYPTDKTEGIVTLIQPGRPPYNWQVPNFVPPAVNNTQSDLLIYELLIRDFNESRSISDAINKLDYLKSIGINAIQLMPIMEFDGNSSWGYSTNFFFATDKYYGTREAYKQFIDAAHAKGIAVILDIVVNHAFGLNPMVKMYFDPNFGGYGAPSVNNPWFNQQSPHPYGVGYDFNHESPHTRQFFKDVFQYWLTEFKVDGFRLDLSKGLTQNYTGGDIGAWNAYDQSRVNIIMDYYNHIKWVKPNAYVILEHFANNDEETVLANAGMLLWSAMHHNYKQVAMGWENNSNVAWAYHGTRGWSYPNLIDYMESHDEERMVYEALAYGNQSQWYNLRDSLTAIRHQEQAVVLFMGIPGPKMIWQFQEMGYDYSIWFGGDRTAPKPPRWDYLDNPVRERLARVIKGMADLRKSDAFRYGNFTHDLGGLGKRMWITHSSMDVVICVNMGVFGFDMIPNFTKPGTWYDYFSGQAINVSNPSSHSFFFGPGDYRVFTTVPLNKPWHELTVNVRDAISNQAIANARVQLANAGARFTNANGQVLFLALPGNNSVSASKFGYLPESQSFIVNSPAEITILLSPGWDPNENFANLQWPPTATITAGQSVNVYAQVEVPSVPLDSTGYQNMSVWIGYHSSNTNPNSWTNWIPATYNGISGFTGRPEYVASIGSNLPEGTYFYASRFHLPDLPYIYGGYSNQGGGFWDGTTNISGVLTVNPSPPAGITFANLQWPPGGAINTGGNLTVYAQVLASGTNLGSNGYEGLTVWIGYGSAGTAPSSWTNWIPATYNGISGFTGRPEYTANIGSNLPEGVYHYASRFKLDTQSFVYGGYSNTGGGFWDGINNISGQLIVNNQSVTYPVLFTVTDQTGNYVNIKLKGSMTNWQPVAMQRNGNVWTLSLNLLPNIYEWGVIEDDGSPEGIWLVQGPNLSFTLSPNGNVSGITSYTINFLNLNELEPSVKLFPNPNHGKFTLEVSHPEQIYSFWITDATGKLIKHNNNIKPLEIFDLSFLQPAIYMIYLRSKMGLKVYKFIIIK